MTEPQAQASWMLLPRFSKHDSGSESTQVNSESLQSLTWVLILRRLAPPADETCDEKASLLAGFGYPYARHSPHCSGGT